METYYAQVALASKSGETADVAVNVFAVRTDAELTSGEVDTWQVAIKKFYDACRTGGALCGRASTGHQSKFLKATMSVPNYPLFTRDWNLASNPPIVDLPEEVALCVSYSSDSFPAVPRASRRGRIYISGWTEATNDTGRPSTAAYEALATAYAAYADDVYAISGMAPGVWSRTLGDVYPIDRVWCDNEWDTMRSRGGKSTLRKTIIL